jgi:hypothetical protein
MISEDFLLPIAPEAAQTEPSAPSQSQSQSSPLTQA